MSGYLHRLVQTVSQPRQTVHPRTGSVFAPYSHGADAATGPFQSAETAAINPAPSESPKAVPRAEPVRRSDARMLFEPDEEPNRVEATRAASRQSEHAIPVPNSLAAPRLEFEPAVPTGDRESVIENYEILIQPQSRERNAVEPASAQRFTEATPQRDSRPIVPAGTRSARAAERQPDEIQIHIGRIEVTAVQPPAPRAPKPRDSGISLEAYLARRNGRPR